jgi:hypothetical protein
MAASATPSGRTRLDRAAAAAVQLRAAIPQVESGVLTLTDRVLPDLLPVADVEGFDGVVRHAVRIESPPPRATSLRATSYDVLGDIAAGNDFAPGASRRIVVLLTDGESNPVQAGDLATRLAVARGYRFVAIRFWRSNESVFGADGKRESAYRPDPGGQATIHELVAALDGRSFEEGQLSAASAYLQRVAGSGPSVRVAGVDTRRVPLAPYAALAGLLALILAVRFSRLAPRGLRLIRQ